MSPVMAQRDRRPARCKPVRRSHCPSSRCRSPWPSHQALSTSGPKRPEACRSQGPPPRPEGLFTFERRFPEKAEAYGSRAGSRSPSQALGAMSLEATGGGGTGPLWSLQFLAAVRLRTGVGPITPARLHSAFACPGFHPSPRSNSGEPGRWLQMMRLREPADGMCQEQRVPRIPSAAASLLRHADPDSCEPMGLPAGSQHTESGPKSFLEMRRRDQKAPGRWGRSVRCGRNSKRLMEVHYYAV